MIIIVFLSKNKNINNVIYNKFPSHLNMNKNLKYLFDISSTVNYKILLLIIISMKIGLSLKVVKENYFLKQILKD